MSGPVRGTPRGVPNLAAQLAELRREVEQLRREVRELRERGPGPVVIPVQPDTPPRRQGLLWAEARPPDGWPADEVAG